MKQNYFDVDYFLNKFDAIPENEWTTHTYTRYEEVVKHCVFGHCGVRVANGIDTTFTNESQALVYLFDQSLKISVININDNNVGFAFDLEETPKQHIMSALILIKAGVTI